jgi:5-methylcytosine-specific restriction endonuclease McrA
MQRKRPFLSPERRSIPRRVRAEVMLRQDGRCADCGTRLIIGFFVFDHRPPIGVREQHENVNDPDRLAAICWTCNERKTPRDLKEIAKAKRVAEKHQDFLQRQMHKVPGRRVPSRKERQAWERMMRTTNAG